MRTGARNPQKVLCPESTCIFQSIPNVVLLSIRKIFDFTENNIVSQVADVLLQLCPHQVET